MPRSSDPDYVPEDIDSPDYVPEGSPEGSPDYVPEDHDESYVPSSPGRIDRMRDAEDRMRDDQMRDAEEYNRLEKEKPELPVFNPRKSKTRPTRKELDQIQEERKKSLSKKRITPVRTGSEEELLRHYKEYTRKSPKTKESNMFHIFNWGPGDVDHYLPSSVLLLIAMHGRTKEPFLSPLNVVRHIGAEFGACYANYSDKNYGDETYGERKMHEPRRSLMGDGFLEDRNRSVGEVLKKSILAHIRHYRRTAEHTLKIIESDKTRNPSLIKNYDSLVEFVNSKHHVRPKHIKKGLPMFNKSYGMTGEKHETHETHSIFVRADLPLERVDREDVFFEMRIEETTLKDILKYLVKRGVRNVTLFDLSCQGDDRSPIHRTRYGGKK